MIDMIVRAMITMFLVDAWYWSNRYGVHVTGVFVSYKRFLEDDNEWSRSSHPQNLEFDADLINDYPLLRFHQRSPWGMSLNRRNSALLYHLL